MSSLTLVVLLLIQATRMASSSQECTAALGMETSKIPDEKLKAPSWLYYDKSYSLYYRPYYGRLNYKKGGGAWCSEDIERFSDQYLEIDLGKNIRLTAIATQGRHSGSEYVNEFGITYRRNGDTAYRKHTENGKWKIMAGNNDTDSIVTNVFSHPFVARWIRIVPRGNLFSIYCLRAELYGCEWKKTKDNLLLYTSHVGYHDQTNDFRDIDYDGTISSLLGLVTDGLGRLTDDVYGNAIVNSGLVSKWVGFHAKRPVVSFQFAKTRIFHSVIFHVYNQAATIRLFAKVDVEISLSGVNFSLIASRRTTDTERAAVGPLSVKVNLGGVISRFVKCRLSQLGTLVLISEVDFKTESFAAMSRVPLVTTPATHSVAIHRPITLSPLVTVNAVELKPRPTAKRTTQSPVQQRPINRQNNGWNDHYDNGLGPDEEESAARGLSFPIIIAIALGAIVLVSVLMLFVVRECRRFNHRHHRHGEGSGSKAVSGLLGNGKMQLSYQDTSCSQPCGQGPVFTPLKANLV